MSESSTEKKSAEEAEVDPKQDPQKGPKQVPVEAVAKERAEKRAARDEAARLKEAVGKQSELDDALIEQLAVQAKAAVDRELAPEREARAKAERENSLLRLRLDHGLNDAQAEKTMEFHAKNPNLTVEQALTLIRAENPDDFPTGQARRVFPIGLPVGGNSSLRGESNQEDHVKKMREARASGDWQEARRHAALEFERRFQGLRNMAPRT